MKECELCKSPARMYCESDQARLCWDCDAKVHGANFLVAKHSRCLLCHVCQSPTPWKASGPKLGSTVSVCERCANSCKGGQDRAEVDREEENQDEEIDSENESEDDDDDDDDDDGDENDDDEFGDDGNGDGDDEDGDNQVVPWSSFTPPPPIASSSSSEESSSRFCHGGGVSGTALSLKRMRENVDLGFQDDLCYSSSEPNYNATLSAAMAQTADEEATSFGSLRKKSLTIQLPQVDLKPAVILSSLKRFEKNMISGDNSATTILSICKLSKDPEPTYLISPQSPSPPI